MEKNKEQIKWEKSHTACEQLQCVVNWCDYEDYGVIAVAKTMQDLIKLYLFVNFICDVEFVSEV